jgi:hypothetical protein
MAQQYQRQPEDFRIFNLTGYINLVISFLERPEPAIIAPKVCW